MLNKYSTGRKAPLSLSLSLSTEDINAIKTSHLNIHADNVQNVVQYVNAKNNRHHSPHYNYML